MTLPPVDFLEARYAQLRRLLASRELDAMLFTSLPNVTYFTGFQASAAALIVTADLLEVISDARYRAQLDARAREWPTIHPVHLPPGASYDEAIVDRVRRLKGLRVGFEADHLTVRRHRFLVSQLTEDGWQSLPEAADGLAEQLRAVKDAWEVANLRDAAGRLSDVAKCILPNVLAGRSEGEVAADIESRLRRAGFERPSFDTIVAAGPNAALPHARAGRRRIEEGDLVVLDFGGVLNGYCTDLTRTVVVGTAGARERKAIEQVVEAQAAAFEVVAGGAAPESVDAAAREVLATHGVAEAFTHGTGHGLGLEIHEAPRVSRARPGHPEPPLAAGMVLTLEPGVYFPGWGGVRIEDDVLVTEGGAEWLTDVPRAR